MKKANYRITIESGEDYSFPMISGYLLEIDGLRLCIGKAKKEMRQWRVTEPLTGLLCDMGGASTIQKAAANMARPGMIEKVKSAMHHMIQTRNNIHVVKERGAAADIADLLDGVYNGRIEWSVAEAAALGRFAKQAKAERAAAANG